MRLGLIFGQLSLVSTEREGMARFYRLRTMQACVLRRMLGVFTVKCVVRCLSVTFLLLVLHLNSCIEGLLRKVVKTFTVPELLFMYVVMVLGR